MKRPSETTQICIDCPLERNTIWCLFSVANEYDQPEHNLETFYFEKPNKGDIMKFLRCNEVEAEALLRSERTRIKGDYTDYYLEEVESGNKL